MLSHVSKMLASRVAAPAARAVASSCTSARWKSVVSPVHEAALLRAGVGSKGTTGGHLVGRLGRPDLTQPTPEASNAATIGAMFEPLSATPSTSFDVRPLTGACGAEVYGVDLSRPLSTTATDVILDAFHDYGCVFFRDQDISEQDHVNIARTFGEPVPHSIVKGLDSYPDITEIVKEAGEVTRFGETWHSDNSFEAEPCLGSILVGRVLPSYGNDTMFANMNMVFESLSPTLQDVLLGLTSLHTAARAFSSNDSRRAENFAGDAKMKYDPAAAALNSVVEHPAVITHPVSGRKVLYVNEMFTIGFKGMTEEESAPLLAYLFKQVNKPQFQARFSWAPGSVAFWDNRLVQHIAVADQARERRVMHRITLRGAAPSQ